MPAAHTGSSAGWAKLVDAGDIRLPEPGSNNSAFPQNLRSKASTFDPKALKGSVVAFLGSSRTSQVEGLTLLSPAEGLEAPDLREFLTILATSTLQSFTWNFCGLYTSGLQSEAPPRRE